MGPDKMSALFGKCLSFRDFVPRMAPVPINDPVCVLKSAGLLSGKREWAAVSLLDTHLAWSDTSKLLTGADKSLKG